MKYNIEKINEIGKMLAEVIGDGRSKRKGKQEFELGMWKWRCVKVCERSDGAH